MKHSIILLAKMNNRLYFQALVLPLVLPLVLATHYTFSRVGYGVFSSDVENLAIPVGVLQLKPAMINLQKIIKNLQQAATTHGSHRVLGPILSSLASTSTEHYVLLEDRCRNVINFFSSKPHPLPGQPIDTNFSSLIITPLLKHSQEEKNVQDQSSSPCLYTVSGHSKSRK